uniref:Nonstructural protein 1 n=1 Tax=Turdus hortulorum parvoviridae sp. TaxID=2794538 RepID=A0A8A4XCS6_9VIRU|nr:MAG: nonstructural protein 1 [Turdus hortulorum parvoviridae sp.]
MTSAEITSVDGLEDSKQENTLIDQSEVWSISSTSSVTSETRRNTSPSHPRLPSALLMHTNHPPAQGPQALPRRKSDIEIIELGDGRMAVVTTPAEIAVYRKLKRVMPEADLSMQGSAKKGKRILTSDLFDYVLRHRITNRSEFDGRPADEIKEFLMMNNIESALPRAFNFTSMQIRNDRFEPYGPEHLLDLRCAILQRVPRLRLFLCGVQNWTVKQYKFFMKSLYIVANMETTKKNCIWVWGPSNTGKSTVMDSFIACFFESCVGKPDNNERTSFPFNSCVNRRVIFWEEPSLRPNNIEDVKCLMSGTTFSTDIKYQSAVTIKRTPVFVTANRTPWTGMQDANIMMSRCFTFKFNTVLDKEFLEDKVDMYFPLKIDDWRHAFYECISRENELSDQSGYLDVHPLCDLEDS